MYFFFQWIFFWISKKITSVGSSTFLKKNTTTGSSYFLSPNGQGLYFLKREFYSTYLFSKWIAMTYWLLKHEYMKLFKEILRSAEEPLLWLMIAMLLVATWNGILLPKLFWPSVRTNCSSDQEKLLKFEAEGQEFATY